MTAIGVTESTACHRTLLALGREARLQTRPIRFAFDDQIIGSASEAIDHSARESDQRTGEPFVRPAVRRDHDRPGPIPLEQNVIEVPALGLPRAVRAQPDRHTLVTR